MPQKPDDKFQEYFNLAEQTNCEEQCGACYNASGDYLEIIRTKIINNKEYKEP